MNFTTDSDNVRDLSAVNTANSLEVTWLEIPSNCSESAQILVEANGEIQPLNQSDFVYKDHQKGKLVHWRNPKALTACTTYRIKVGSAMTNVSTPMDSTTGSISNVRFEQINATLTEIRWDPPSCKRGTIRHLGLQLRSDKSDKLSTLLNVTIHSSIMSHTIDSSSEPIQMRRPLDKSISNLHLNPCQTYYATVVTQWEDGRSFTVEQPITIADPSCLPSESSSLTTAAVVVLCLLVILLIIVVAMIYYFRIRKRREEKGLPPLSVRLSSLIPAQFTGSPSNKTRPLKHADLLQFDEELLKREFKSLQITAEEEAAQQPRTVAANPENRIKNRFKNIHPFDANRVVLQILPDDPNSDYINASFIAGYSGEKKFIAAQGPKRETVSDFWRMIWEQNIHLVVMVTTTKEDGITKCEQYWPEKGAPTSYVNVQLSLQEEIDHSFYTHRKILASRDGVRRKITQLHFTAWPDFDIPDEPEEMIRFVEIVRRESELLNQKSKSPILVHCSAGVGRTGTYMALDFLIHQIQTKDKIDILATVLQLRRSRVAMVQSEPQYLFLYTCMAHYALTRLNLQDEAGPVYENVYGTSTSFENLEYDNVGHNPMQVRLLGRV